MDEEATQKRTAAFDESVKLRLHDHAHILEENGKVQPFDWSTHPFNDDLDFQEEFNNVTSNEEAKEDDDLFTLDMYDTYLNMELVLPQGDSLEPRLERVTKRLKDANGIPIGTADDNPLLDTRMYEVEYLDGEHASLSANHIAENPFTPVDDEGNRQVLMKEIIDYCTNGQEVKQQDAFIKMRTGTKRRRETTKGWEILIKWKDDSMNWVALKDVKESYPVQVAEFAISNCIAEEPAFAWWVPFMMKKRNRILAKVKSKYWLRSHKFGIRIPKTVEEVKKVDDQNGNTLWSDAICKEMRNVRPAFEVFEGTKDQLPVGYQYMKCHMIFDIKSGEYDWYNFYQDAKEQLPSDMPPLRGRLVSTHCFVDSDHTGDKVTRRSQTGILIFLNRAPIIWYSKRQNTVETSMFGSEFITMKTVVEQIKSLRYKLRMFGVPLEGPTNVFCDNEAVFKNMSQPDSTLKKKHMLICYHHCREAVACWMIRIAKEGTLTNLSDLFTKPLTHFIRENLLDCFTY